MNNGLPFPKAPIFWDVLVNEKIAYLLTSKITEMGQVLLTVDTENLNLLKQSYLDTPVQIIAAEKNIIIGYSVKKNRLFKYELNDKD